MKGTALARKYGSLKKEKEYYENEISAYKEGIDNMNQGLTEVEKHLKDIQNAAPELVRLLDTEYTNLKEEK